MTEKVQEKLLDVIDRLTDRISRNGRESWSTGWCLKVLTAVFAKTHGVDHKDVK